MPTVDQASLFTPVAVPTPGSDSVTGTTDVAIAAGAYVVAEVGWFDATDTIISATVDGNAVDDIWQGVNSSHHVALIGYYDTAGRASGKVIEVTFSGIPTAGVALSAMSWAGTDPAAPVASTIGPTNGTTADWESASALLPLTGALVAAARAEGFGTATHAATGGTTEAADVSSDGSGNVLVYRIEADGGDFTCTGTFTGTTSPYVNLGIVLQPEDATYPEPPPVEFVSQGAAVAGTTSITTAAYGTGWADGDLIVGTVASNHATTESTEPTIAGFDLIGTLNGGGGAQGAGTGNRRLSFFTREAVTGDDTTPAVDLSGGNVMIAAFTVFRKAAGYTWDTVVAAFGAETTAGTAWSQVMTTDPGFDAADMLHAACAIRDTSTSSAEGFTATGATFSALTERIDSASETGNDISLHVQTADVLTGPSSAAGTSTATHSTSETGVMGVLRIRATASSGDGTATPAAIAVTAALPAAATGAGSSTSPAVVVAATALPAATPKAGGNATPAVTTAALGIPAPTLSGGGKATPAATAATLALPAATGSGGGRGTPAATAVTATIPAATTKAGGDATPGAVAITVTLPAASATGGGSVTVTPDPVTVTAALPAPTTGAGSTASPAVIATTVTLPAATLGAGATASPAVIPITIALPAPAASGSGSGTAAPAVITCTAALPATTESGGGTGIPATVPLTLTFPAASAQAPATATPAAIPITVTAPAATASGSTSGTATPSTVALVTAVPNPGIAYGTAVNPATVALAITLAAAIASGQPPDPNPVTITVTDLQHTVTVTGLRATATLTGPRNTTTVWEQE